jgi:signal peptidase I
MRPFIKNGSFVFIEHIAPAAFRPGDNILYKSGGGLFIHRIKAVIYKLASNKSVVESFEITDDAAVILPDKVCPEEVLGRPV